MWTVLRLLTVCVIGTLAEQQVLSVASIRHAITPETDKLGEELLDIGIMKGLSVGVIHSNDTSEYKAWGVRSEDGDRNTPEVSLFTAQRHTGIYSYS